MKVAVPGPFPQASSKMVVPSSLYIVVALSFCVLQLYRKINDVVGYSNIHKLDIKESNRMDTILSFILLFAKLIPSHPALVRLSLDLF